MSNTVQGSSYKFTNKIIQKVQKKYGAKDWEEFDKLQQQDRELVSGQQSGQNQTKKIKKKPNRKQKKHGQIQQYQKALKRLRLGGHQFHNPFERQKLNLEKMPVLQMLRRAFQRQYNLQDVLKKMGMKTAKILFKTGAKTNIGFMLYYLKEQSIPSWIIERHRDMMKKRDDEFNSDQNTLLRTMSSNNNTCLS